VFDLYYYPKATQYLYILDNINHHVYCANWKINTTLNPWEFIDNAIYVGSCMSFEGVKGYLWSSSSDMRSICVSVDGNKPYWYDFVNEKEVRVHEDYTYFSPTRPDPNLLKIPDACNQLD